MANTKYSASFTIDIGANISKLQSALNNVKSYINSSFKLDSATSSSLNKTFDDLAKNIEKYRDITSKPFSGDADVKQSNKYWTAISDDIEKINDKVKKIKGIDPKKLVPQETVNKLNQLNQKLADYEKLKIDRDNKKLGLTEQINESSKKVDELKSKLAELKEKSSLDSDYGKKLAEDAAEAKKAYDELLAAKNTLSSQKGSQDSEVVLLNEQVKKARKEMISTDAAYNKFVSSIDSSKSEYKEVNSELAAESKHLKGLKSDLEEVNRKAGGETTAALTEMRKALADTAGIDFKDTPKKFEDIKQAILDLDKASVDKIINSLENIPNEEVQQLATNLKQAQGEIDGTGAAAGELQRQMDGLASRLTNFFTLTQGFDLLKRGLRDAFDIIKSLDAAMTEIAVVSNYTVDDVWSMRNVFVKSATDIGASTQDLVEATTLYVQQGLNLADAQKIATETMKMGRIAGLDGKDATDLMTAAVRGYRMELTDANHVNDVYSELAAKSASNTEELATAMSKTASTAYTSGASFENMSAFLAQIIETTREAPETAGTAMKTIISRFQELKKAVNGTVEVEGEVVDVNKVETALRTAGVALRDSKGEFRAFDDVILELSSKWDKLDLMTQRYIATIAAGSRQQSRFLALLNDNERLVELVGYANNAAGASQEQFNKTLDSLQAKLNQLKNAWELFITGLGDNKIIGFGVKLATVFINIINKIFGVLNNSQNIIANITGSLLQLATVFGTFIGLQQLVYKLLGQGKKAIISTLFAVIRGEKVSEDANKTLVRFGETLKRIKDGGIAGFKDSLTSLWQAFTSHLPIILGVGAALAALAFMYYEVSAATYTAAEQEESYKTAVEKTKQTLDSTKKQYDSLIEKRSKISELNDDLAMLTEGTAGWNEKLQEVNKEILEIINQFPQLAQFMSSSNGLLSISDEGWDYYSEVLNESVQNASRSNLRAQKDLANFYMDQALSQFYDEMGKQGISRSDALEYAKGNKTLEGLDEKQIEGASQAILDYNSAITQQEATLEGLNNAISNTYSQEGLEDSIASQLALSVEKEYEELHQQYSDAAQYGRAYMGKTVTDSEGNTYAVQTKAREIFKEIERDPRYRINANNFGFSNYGVKGIIGGQVTNVKTLQEFYRKVVSPDIPPEIKDDAEALRQAVLDAYFNDKIEDDINKRANTIKKLGRKEQKQITEAFSVINGIFDGDISELITPEKFMDSLKGLGLSDKDWESLGYESAEEFAEAYRTGWESQYDFFGQTIKETLEIALRAGLSSVQTEKLGAFISDNLSIPQMKQLTGILNSGWSGTQQQSILTQLQKSSNSEFFLNALSNIDLSNPIAAMRQLENMAKSSDDALKGLAKGLIESGKNAIGASQQFKYLYNQMTMNEDLMEDLADMYKDGPLSGFQVKELAKDFDLLSQYIDTSALSLEGLTKLLNLLHDNEITLDSITNPVIAALSQLSGWEGLVSEVSDWATNFKPAEDSDAGINFLSTAADKVVERIEAGKYNNTEMLSYMGAIFNTSQLNTLEGSDYEDRLETYSNLLKQMKEDESTLVIWEQMMKGLDVNGDVIDQNLLDEIGLELDEETMRYNLKGADGTMSTKELTEKFAKAMGLTEEAAAAMVTDFLQYASVDVKRALNQADLTAAVKEAGKELNGYISSTEVEAIAKAYETTPEKVIAEFEKQKPEIKITTGLYDKDGNRILNGQQLLDSLETGLGTEGKENFVDKYLNFKNAEADLSKINQGLEDLGLTAEQSGAVIQAAIDKSFDEDNLEELTVLTEEGLEVKLTVDSHDLATKTEEAVENAGYAKMAQAFAEEFKKVKMEVDNSEAKDSVTEVITLLDEAKGKIDDLPTIRPDVDFQAIQALRTEIQNLIGDINRASNSARSAAQQLAYGGGSSKSYEQAKATGTTNSRNSYTSLVGELGPELIWNESRGAYLSGIGGPEITTVHRGDTIYTAKETEEIFKRKGKHLPNFVHGMYARGYGPGDNGAASNGAASNAEATESANEETEAWTNSIDFLTKELSYLNELQNQYNELELQREILLLQQNSTVEQLNENYEARLSLLKQEAAQQKQNLKLSRQELERLKNEYADVAKYISYNEKTGLYYNRAATDSVTDEELGKRIEEAKSAFENVGSKIDEARKGILENQKAQLELLREGRDEASQLEEDLIEAIYDSRQEEIEKISEHYEAINQANEDIISALEEGVQEYRDQRAQDEALADLQKQEQQIALMSMDTSGSNQLDILKAQKTLDDARQSYTDSLIDKSISEMTTQNEEAAKQRQRQIDLMTAKLEWDKEHGNIAKIADTLLSKALLGDSQALQEISNLLGADNKGKGKLAKMLWNEDFNNSIKQAAQYLQERRKVTGSSAGKTLSITDKKGRTVSGKIDSNGNLIANGKTYTGIVRGFDGKYYQNSSGSIKNNNTTTSTKNTKDTSKEKIATISKNATKRTMDKYGWSETEDINHGIAEVIVQYGGDGSGWGNGFTRDSRINAKNKNQAAKVQSLVNQILSGQISGHWHEPDELKKYFYAKFETGGLADFTGPAWLDGTKSKPEYVLNAEQTQKFFDLLDFTRNIATDSKSTSLGDTYVTVQMNNEISSDYDVDEMWEEMKRKIAQESNYRNVNVLDFNRR